MSSGHRPSQAKARAASPGHRPKAARSRESTAAAGATSSSSPSPSSKHSRRSPRATKDNPAPRASPGRGLSPRSAELAEGIRDVLSNGVHLDRHSTLGPQQMKLWLQGDTIYWRVVKPGSDTPGRLQSMELDEVLYIEAGCNTAAFARASPLPDESRCFSLVGRASTLDVECGSQQERDVIARGFMAVLRYFESTQAQASFSSGNMSGRAPGAAGTNGSGDGAANAGLSTFEIAMELEGELGQDAGYQPDVWPNPVHYAAWHVVKWPYFDTVILACILINCVTMALFDPLADPVESLADANTPLEKALFLIEDILLYIFTLEMFTKITALGISQKNKTGYIDDNWNRLDCFIVIIGWMGLVPGVGNFTMFRVLRVLRPLRSINKLKGMRILIQAMLEAVGPLGDVCVLSFFVFVVFGILGMDLFRGKTTQRCFRKHDDPGFEKWGVMPDDKTTPLEERRCGAHYHCPDRYKCYTTGETADFRYPNPANDILSFDDIGHAFLTIFIAITLEGWVDMMYSYQDSYNYWVATIYWFALILFGSLFVLNLALAVIEDKYSENKEKLDEEIRLAAEMAAEKVALEADTDNDGIISPEEAAAAAAKAEAAAAPPGFNSGWRSFFTSVSYDDRFNNLIMVCIGLNTLALAMEHKTVVTNCYVWDGDGEEYCMRQSHDMPKGLTQVLNVCNFIFMAIFAAEMVIKMIGLGLEGYFADNFNSFDCFVVIGSFVEAFAVSGGGGGLSALRTFRLARVFKMVKSWKSLRVIMTSLLEALPQIGYIGVLLLLYMFVAAVAGMQLFGKAISKEERHNFSSFPVAMLTVFQMLSGENWNDVLYSAIDAKGYFSVVYFVLVVIVGMFIVLNLFVAVLLSTFGEDDEDEDEADEDKPAAVEAAATGPEADPAMADKNMSEVIAMREAQKKANADIARNTPVELLGVTCGFMGPDHALRRSLAVLVTNPYFDGFIITCILVSSITLAVEGPSLTDKRTLMILGIMDYAFSAIFFLEMSAKLAVYGVYEGPTGYLKDSWNRLDGFIVGVSILNIGLANSGSSLNVGFLKSLRTLRALRPLRTIKRFPGLKLVVDVLIKCAPVFVNICFVALFFYLIFAILGVQFFAGKFWACNDDSVEHAKECIGYFTDEESGDLVKRDWHNLPMHFDNVANAMLTLFEVASLELWLDVMYAGMDSRAEINLQPKRDNSPMAAFFFVVFVVVGAFLVMNLFVGAVVDKFNELRDENKDMMMTEAQAAFVASMKSALKNKPERQASPPPKTGLGCVVWFRRKCWDIMMWDSEGKGTGTGFDLFCGALIFANILVMAMYVWVPPNYMKFFIPNSEELDDLQNSDYNHGLDVINDVFTWVFVVEMIIKMAALGQSQYWADGWNQLDAFIVFVSCLGFFADYMAGVLPINPNIFRILRVMRLLRALRVAKLIKQVKGVLRLIETLILSLPALSNVSMLLFLMLFIFTVLFMNFFGTMATNEPYEYGLYNDHANFKYFHTGFITLFRMSTGESWCGIVRDIMTVYPWAWLFFVIYMIVVAFLLFNLLIAIVLDQFGQSLGDEALDLSPEVFDGFNTAWAKFDKKASHFMPSGSLPLLLERLPDPLGCPLKIDRLRAIKSMDITQDASGKIHFVDTLTALIKHDFVKKRYHGNYAAATELDAVGAEIADEVALRFPSVRKQQGGGEDFAKTYASMVLQARMKGVLIRARKRIEERRLREGKGGGGGGGGGGAVEL